MPAPSGLDGAADSLVPGSPVSALICAYPGNTRSGGLAGSRTLTGQARAMAHDLGYLPVGTDGAEIACTLMAGPATNYLVRFAYPDGRGLWLGSAEEVNSCVTTTNGTALSHVYVGDSLTAAYRTGTWRLDQPERPCPGSLGRRGQDARMVPEGPVKVVVCRIGRHDEPARRTEYGAKQAHELAAALNSVAAGPSRNACHPLRGVGGGRFEVLFGYADGPPASVRVTTACRPSANNGLLEGHLDDTVRDRVAQLAPP
ncbi:hypothetical protein ACBJ59_36925 [Nonomuraea sp. MTCD27]|uniref:hypothetical protein n=1 Tax=Nonomuraea sp. MTCD27 TaxID=1676747 RepID=UPI0035C0B4CE